MEIKLKREKYSGVWPPPLPRYFLYHGNVFEILQSCQQSGIAIIRALHDENSDCMNLHFSEISEAIEWIETGLVMKIELPNSYSEDK